MGEVEEAFKVLNNPRSRRTYDRGTPATREELYYKAVKYIGKDGEDWKTVAAGKYMVEVHSGAARLPKTQTIHNRPPNWARLMTKTSKVLNNAVKLGRINVDAEPELAEELKLNGVKMPYMLVVINGKHRVYKGEPRILKMADFVGDGIEMGAVDSVTYSNVEDWKRSAADAVKVLLFRKTFSSMVLNYREVAEDLEGAGFKFGEVDVRSRGAVNLWRRFNLRRLPLVAVLRDDDKEPGVLGGSVQTNVLRNFLMINKNPTLPRVSTENFEDSCIGGSKRFCAILAVDPRTVTYRRINETLGVFTKAQAMIANHPEAKNIEFMWADKIADYLNSTESWKSLYTVFGEEKPAPNGENFYVTDNYYMKFKSFGGNLNKVTDLSDKEEEFKDFITSILDNKAARMQSLPSPIFKEPPPPPYTQEDITRIFVVLVVCLVALAALTWSYITFQQEAAIREAVVEAAKAAGKKIKKEKRDGEYGVGDD
jgi:hypothetical protein